MALPKNEVVLLKAENFGEEIELEIGGNGFILKTADGIEIILEDGQASVLMSALYTYLDEREEAYKNAPYMVGVETTVTFERINGFLSGVFWAVLVCLAIGWWFT